MRQLFFSLSYFTLFFSIPMAGMVISTVSPEWRKRGGLKPTPTPLGVPVAMMSPGKRVVPWEMVWISSGMVKMNSPVEPS